MSRTETALPEASWFLWLRCPEDLERIGVGSLAPPWGTGAAVREVSIAPGKRCGLAQQKLPSGWMFGVLFEEALCTSYLLQHAGYSLIAFSFSKSFGKLKWLR